MNPTSSFTRRRVLSRRRHPVFGVGVNYSRDVPGQLLLVAAVTIMAFDSTGHVTRAHPPAPVIEAARPQSWALLIGVDDYTDLEDNRFCSRQVAGLQSRLIAAGWPVSNVFLMNDRGRSKYVPSKENVERQFGLFSQLPIEKDLAVILFRGRVVDHQGETYLCPTEARRDEPESTLVPVSALYDEYAACRAGTRLVIFDPIGPVDGELLAGLSEAPEGIAVWVSCQAGQTSPEHAAIGGSAFLNALARGLEGQADENGDGRILLSEWVEFAEVECPRVAESVGAANQAPTVYGTLSGAIPVGHVPDHSPAAALYPTLDDDAAERSARLEAVVGINPRSLRAFNEAAMRFAMGDLRETIEYCDDALAMDPQNRWAKVLRACTHCRLRNFAKALEDYAALGVPLPCHARSKANLMKGKTKTGSVLPGDVLYVTTINGDWLWVDGIAGDEEARGWIQEKHVR